MSKTIIIIITVIVTALICWVVFKKLLKQAVQSDEFKNKITSDLQGYLKGLK